MIGYNFNLVSLYQFLNMTTKCNLSFLLFILVFIFIFGSSNNAIIAQETTSSGAQEMKIEYLGKSKPLRELVSVKATAKEKRDMIKANKVREVPPNFINYRRPYNPNQADFIEDPIRQKTVDRGSGFLSVLPRVTLEGISEEFTDIGVPDTNGDASKDHYIQIVNATWLQIFAKDGTAVTEPIAGNTIWSQINKQSFSDPVVLYDEAAERWLLTDLANIDEVLFGVSETSDPLGSWFLYSFNTQDWADYPKYGIWNESYIITTNGVFGNSYPVHAINRQQLLAGNQNVDVQLISLPRIQGGFPVATPMDWNSPTPPPSNTAYVVRLNDDSWGNGNTEDVLEVWGLDIDWENPNNTSANLTSLPVSAYNSDGCSVVQGGGFACIPQPGTEQGIDGIMTIIMHNIAYWNYGTHESAVLAFSARAATDLSGIRWTELRRYPGEKEWSLYQQGTYAPDDDYNRFIPAISINGKGDIALGYSVGGTDKFASLRYTGRLVDDPLGEMTVEEFEFATGEGVRGNGNDRFGDYARMSVDPLDGSFWFTGEYVKLNGSYGTSIVNFILTRDSLDLAATAIISPVNSSELGSEEKLVVEIRNVGVLPVSNFSVGFVLDGGIEKIELAEIDTLFSNDVYIHAFSDTLDLANIRSYDFKVFTIYEEDQNIQNDTLSREIRKLPQFDMEISKFLAERSCADSLTTTLTVTNQGTDTIFNFTLQYILNNADTFAVDWIGELITKASEDIILNLNNLITGINSIDFHITKPNGVEDQNIENDRLQSQVEFVENGEVITLELQLDFYSYETTWELETDNGEILYVNESYNDDSFIEALVTSDWCLNKDSCFVFTIYDSYGDGLESPGNYVIRNEFGEVLAGMINAFFGFEEINSFCASLPCNLAAFATSNPASGPQVNDGDILVEIVSGVSPFEFSLDNGETWRTSPVFNDLIPGNYSIIIRDAKGCETVISVEVDFISSSIRQDYVEMNITVYPNPSENGAFVFEIEDSGIVDPRVKVIILDINGNTITHEYLAQFNNGHKGIISLARFQAGTYLAYIPDSKIKRLVRLIKM